MTTADEKAMARALVRRYLTALETFDAGTLDALLAPDAVQHEHPSALHPNGATSDRATLLARFSKSRQVLRSQCYEVKSLLVDGDRVAAEVDWAGVLNVTVAGRSAGDTMRAAFAVFFTLRDGRVWRQTNFDCFLPSS